MQINKKGLFTSPFLLESFIILLNEYNGGFSMTRVQHLHDTDVEFAYKQLLDYEREVIK